MLERIYASGKVEDADGTQIDAFPAGVPRAHAEEIARLVRSGGFSRTLETGMAYGLSTLAICGAMPDGGRHIAIDPFQSSDWRSIGMLNVSRAGFADRVRLVEARSDKALPRLLDEGVRLDFALIDGLHLFDATLVDFYFVDRMLDAGGVVVFHDTWMPAVAQAVAYVRANRAYSDVPTCDGLAALRKEGDDSRDWDFHRDFAGLSPAIERVRGAIGTRRRRLETHPIRTRLARNRVTRSVDSRISPRDEMYAGDGKHYFSVGLSALRCIEAAGVAEARRVLDMPCGHGRVLRFLAKRFLEAELVACDLNEDGVAFCARQFGAQPVVSSADLGSLSLPGEFDLIWCGSLVTHLDADANAALLSLFARSLAPGGVAVVTTHGSLVAERLRAGDTYQLTAEAARAVVAGYEAEGFGYAGYPWSDGYGVSLSSREWIGRMARAAGLRETFFGERMWDDHQDVVGLSRVR